MGNSFNLALIKKKSGLDQCLSVSGRAGKSNFCIIRKQLVDFLNGADSGFQRITVIVAVKRIEKGSVLTDQCSLGSCGTCIDSQEAFALICRKVAGFYLVGTLAVMESLIIFFCCKKRLHTFYFEVKLDSSTHAFFQLDQGYIHILFCIQCRTDSCEQMRVIRCDNVFVIQLQSTDKSSLKL